MFQIQNDLDLTAYNTFGFSSSAERFVRITERQELPQLCEYCEEKDLPLLLLGGGSNVVLGKRVPGVVARVEIGGWNVPDSDQDQVIVNVGAGESWHEAVERSLQEGLYGLENLALIPGTVGASPVQNIGAYGVEAKDSIHSVEAFDRVSGAFVEIPKEDCAFGYRDSRFKSGEPGRYIISAVNFRLSREPDLKLDYTALRGRAQELAGEGEVTPRHVFEAVCQLRRSKLPDPEVLGNAGSFFKNPVIAPDQYEELRVKEPNLVAYPDGDGYKLAAGWLIDQCGWKGKRLGQVGVYEKQALVLVNLGGGDRAQIERLAEAIQGAVESRFGVLLEPEPRFYP